MTDDPDFVELRKRLRAPEGVFATRLHATLAVDAAQAAYAIEKLTAERDEARRQWGECEIQRDSQISAVNQMLAAELALVTERSNREFTEQSLAAMQADRDRWLERALAAEAKVAALRGHIERALGQFSRNQGKCCLGGSCTRDQGRDDECALHNVVATLRAASTAPAEPQPEAQPPWNYIKVPAPPKDQP